jgi:hypothetical protein
MASVTGYPRQHTHKQSVHVVTTLYDLVEAVLEEVPSDEQDLVTPVVQQVLRACSKMR